MSCHKKQIREKPVNLLSYEKVTEMVTDISLVESIVYLLPPDSDRLRVSREMYSTLFSGYGVDKDQFISSLSYYLADEDQSLKMLNTVEENVMQREQKWKSECSDTLSHR
jgi:hypothetical protein